MPEFEACAPSIVETRKGIAFTQAQSLNQFGKQPSHILSSDVQLWSGGFPTFRSLAETMRITLGSDGSLRPQPQQMASDGGLAINCAMQTTSTSACGGESSADCLGLSLQRRNVASSSHA